MTNDSWWHRTLVQSSVAALLAVAGPADAQTAPPLMEAVTLEEAVQRALKNNPTIAQASQGILRAEALLQQARSATLPNVKSTQP